MEPIQRENQESFDSIKPLRPPVFLFRKIIKCIAEEKKIKTAKRNFLYSVIAFTGLISSLIWVVISAENALIGSDFSNALSTIFSDPLPAIANWKNFGFFLLESLPLDYLLILFAALFILLLSRRYIAKYTVGMSSIMQSMRAIK